MQLYADLFCNNFESYIRFQTVAPCQTRSDFFVLSQTSVSKISWGPVKITLSTTLSRKAAEPTPNFASSAVIAKVTSNSPSFTLMSKPSWAKSVFAYWVPCIDFPFQKPTYSTFRKMEKSSTQKCWLGVDILVPKRQMGIFDAPWPIWQQFEKQKYLTLPSKLDFNKYSPYLRPEEIHEKCRDKRGFQGSNWYRNNTLHRCWKISPEKNCRHSIAFSQKALKSERNLEYKYNIT